MASKEHLALVQSLIKDGYLHTSHIVEAFRTIDRVHFVPDALKNGAYVNAPLPIGHGQTISQPLTVAFMFELLQPESGHRVLDVGAGSGWTTALLAHIVGVKGKVLAVERVQELAEFGKINVAKFDFIDKGIVEFLCADGSRGYPAGAPYDRILAGAAAFGQIPQAWKEQLAVG